jgi:hypothetical protein
MTYGPSGAHASAGGAAAVNRHGIDRRCPCRWLLS